MHRMWEIRHRMVQRMTEFIQFNWQIFKMLGLVSANTLMVVFLLNLFLTLVHGIFGGGDDDE